MFSLQKTANMDAGRRLAQCSASSQPKETVVCAVFLYVRSTFTVTVRTQWHYANSLDLFHPLWFSRHECCVTACIPLRVLKVFFLSDLLTGLAKTQIMVTSNGH